MAIDPKTRAMIYHLSKIKGLSIRKVARECNVSVTTVWRIHHSKLQVNQAKDLNKKETRGRPPKLTPRDQRQLRRAIHTLRQQEGGFTVKRLMNRANIDHRKVSPCTVSRYLNQQGYYCLQARKKGLLTIKDLKDRRIFARKMIKNYAEDVWTKEIAFYLDGTGFAYKRNPLDQALAPRARIWRKRSEGIDFRCTAKGRKTGSGGKVLKLMVAISYNKGVIVCKPYDKLNGAFFAKFIDDNFEEMFQDADKGDKRLWIQDGDPSQNSAKANTAMKRNNCELIKIPPRSPDLNPIENIFKLVSDALRKQAVERQIERETYEQFQVRVIDTINTLPMKAIDNIIGSMPKRIKLILARKGQRLRY
jgi:transposase